jgi:hypothetical protein
MSRRFVLPFLAVLALTVPLIAQAADVQHFGAQLIFRTLNMRNTSAANNARQPNWTSSSTAAFADSSIFKRGATTATAYDTTVAIARSDIAFPPIFGPGFPAALQDSILPWFILRVKQDSTAYGNVAAPSSSLDSVRVAVEWSDDGINWNAFAGTPTYRFDVAYMTSGADGTVSPTLIGVELLNSYDTVDIPFKCRLSTITGAGLINNLQACAAGTWLRFIIGMDATGQYRCEIGSWQTAKTMN